MAETTAQKVQREDRREKVMELAFAGYSLRRIASEIGVSHVTVSRDIEARLKTAAEASPDTRKYRELHRLRLNRLMTAWWRKALHDPDALGNVLRILDREAKLLGLDAPTKLDHGGSVRVDSKPDLSALADKDLQALRAIAALDPKVIQAILQGKEVTMSVAPSS